MSTNRTVLKLAHGALAVTVIRNSEWQEYRVELRAGPCDKVARATYHADDKNDAISTALVMLARAIAQGV